MNGAPQGSIPGQVLFNTFAGDTDGAIECALSKSANNIKLNGAVNMLEGRDAGWDTPHTEGP